MDVRHDLFWTICSKSTRLSLCCGVLACGPNRHGGQSSLSRGILSLTCWLARSSSPEPHPGGPVVISRQNSQVSTELTGTRLLGSLVWVAVEGFWKSIHRQTCSQRCGLCQLHPAVVKLRQRLLQKRLLFVWQSVGYWLWAKKTRHF